MNNVCRQRCDDNNFHKVTLTPKGNHLASNAIFLVGAKVEGSERGTPGISAMGSSGTIEVSVLLFTVMETRREVGTVKAATCATMQKAMIDCANMMMNWLGNVLNCDAIVT